MNNTLQMVAIGIATYGVCWVAWRVKKTASYWSACKADVLETPGVLTNLIKGKVNPYNMNTLAPVLLFLQPVLFLQLQKLSFSRCDNLATFIPIRSKGPLRWFCINDVIMGGRSESRIATENGKLVFVGNISTVGGGFASIRTTETTLVAMPQGAAGAIKVVVEGDGQMYVDYGGLSRSLIILVFWYSPFHNTSYLHAAHDDATQVEGDTWRQPWPNEWRVRVCCIPFTHICRVPLLLLNVLRPSSVLL